MPIIIDPKPESFINKVNDYIKEYSANTADVQISNNISSNVVTINNLPPLESIKEIPHLLSARELKPSDERGFILVDGIKRKINKSSPYMLDNISIT